MALLPQTAGAQTGGPTLHELLEKTLARQQQPFDASKLKLSVSDWLGGAPSVSVNYLNSQHNQGTDEAEVSVNLPLKSPKQRDNDKALSKSNQLIDDAGAKVRALYFSGLLRQTLWSYAEAEARRKAVADKRQLLKKIQSQLNAQVSAGSAAKYGLLLAKQELLDADMQLMTIEQNIQLWRERLTQLSGQNDLPEQMQEKPVADSQWQLAQHPQVRLLKAEMHQAELEVMATTHDMQPWNLSATVKRIDSPALAENQIGVGIEIPFGSGDSLSQVDQSIWLRTRSQYQLQLDTLYQSLMQQFRQLNAEQQTLENKQSLLQQQADVSRQILAQINQLKQQNEIGQELFLNRMIRALDIQAAKALNQVQIHQNQARLNQAAGVSL